VIASFLAKGLEVRVAAAAGAVACQLASREIPQAGAIAGDVIGALPAVLN